MKIKHVLIADRDLRMCRVLDRVINRLNLKCFSAYENKKFKSLYVELEPDVIMLSLDMAVDDNLLDYLAGQNSQATIILLNNMDEDRSEIVNQVPGLNIGGFLNKPIDIDSVRSTLEGLGENSADTVKNAPTR